MALGRRSIALNEELIRQFHELSIEKNVSCSKMFDEFIPEFFKNPCELVPVELGKRSKFNIRVEDDNYKLLKLESVKREMSMIDLFEQILFKYLMDNNTTN